MLPAELYSATRKYKLTLPWASYFKLIVYMSFKLINAIKYCTPYPKGFYVHDY